MKQVAIIAAATFREHSRRKLIAFFALLSIGLTGVLLYFTRDTSGEAVFGVASTMGTVAALGVLQVLALVVTLAVSMGNIGQPFSSGEALPVLARPVARWQYALGRFFGGIAAIAGLCLLMAVETQVVQLSAAGNVSMQIWGHWAVVLFNMSVVAALTTVLSSFIAVPILVAVIAFFVNQGVGAVSGLYRLVKTNLIQGSFGKLITYLWFVTPKFLSSPLERAQSAALSRSQEGTIEFFVPANDIGLVLWACAWLVGLVLLALFITGRREI